MHYLVNPNFYLVFPNFGLKRLLTIEKCTKKYVESFQISTHHLLIILIQTYSMA